MSEKILLFKPRERLHDSNRGKALIRPLIAIYMRGMKAGASGVSHLEDIIFWDNGHDFPEHRRVFFAGFHDGNIERWSSK